MDIRFIESLLLVVEGGSIASAAGAQKLTAAAISQRLRALENEMGVILLSRQAHAVQPTAACLQLLEPMRRLAKDCRGLAAHIDPTGLSGPFRLGAIASALTDFAPRIVRRLAADAPGVELSITPGSSAFLYDQLRDGRLDAAILIEPPFALAKHMRQDVLRRQPPVMISREKFDAAPPEILRRVPALVYDRHSWGGRIIWRWCEDHQPPRRILCELDSLEAIALLAAEGLGVAIAPKWPGLTTRHPQLTITELENAWSYARSLVLLRSIHNSRAVVIERVRRAIAPDDWQYPHTPGESDA